jgi:hypothetical protein
VSGNSRPDSRSAVADQWLARTLGSYPSLTSHYLLEEKDPFRNPVGRALREALPALVEELLGGMDPARITAALDQVIRMRAVQDFSASQAVGFVFDLRDILRRESPAELTPEVDARIDRMALAAFDVFVKCREKMDRIRVEEARRSVYVLNRVSAARTGGGAR